ncbi:MAG: hypothetical protein JSV57_05780 [Candidatus Bathyarchaeota archaeon]|nr:MAG: hypothetical protein JSV57_05780 [Candidatus Bathyarchaeota archaeon]
MKTEANPVLTPHDLAEYPFTSQAANYIQELEINLKDLANTEYQAILKRAQERIEEAILLGSITKQHERDEIEVSSFPIAIIMAAATNDSYLKRRYALAEAKRAHELLKNEDRKEILLAIEGNFNWKIQRTKKGPQAYAFTLHFTDFLRNSASSHGPRGRTRTLTRNSRC